MKSRNPILPLNCYCPDGEPHFVKDELYVYPSWDKTQKGYCSTELHVVHSKDLSKWEVSDKAFSSEQLLDWEIEFAPMAGVPEATKYKELPQYIKSYFPVPLVPFKWFKGYLNWIARLMMGKKENRLLFAPDSITIGDKSYLFFCTSDGQEGVASSDSPAGPFANPIRITLDRSGAPIKGIDPAAFKYDGRVYLYWGQIYAYAGELTEDLTKVKEDTLVKGVLTEKEHCFHEGSSLRKRNGIYYYIFADTHRTKPTALGYAISKSPLGPFEYKGIIIDNVGCDPQSWNNHGSMECINGQWYIFYHRSTNNSRYLRRMCAEPLLFDENGLIKEVKPTSIGMGDPYKKGEPLYGYQACKVSKKAYIFEDSLIVRKGKSEVVYRYIDKSCLDIESISYQGDGQAKLDFKVDEDGELTIYISAIEKTRIKRFDIE